MNAKAFKALANFFDYIDNETVVVFRPEKKVIQDYAETFYKQGYQQGQKDAFKYVSAMFKEEK